MAQSNPPPPPSPNSANHFLKLALFGPNGASKTKVRDIRVAAYRMVRPKPGSFQSLVKVTGHGSVTPAPRNLRGTSPIPGAGPAGKSASVMQHGRYITRDYALDAENELGQSLKAGEEVREYLHERKDRILKAPKRNKRQRDVAFLVFPVPEHAQSEDLKSATRATLKELFPNRNYVFVLHERETDPWGKTKNPHVHADVEMVDKDGNNRLNIRLQDIHTFREAFAGHLNALGYEVRVVSKERFERAKGQHREATIANFAQAAKLLGKEINPKSRELAQELKVFVGSLQPELEHGYEHDQRQK
jgi:hypothetical protein